MRGITLSKANWQIASLSCQEVIKIEKKLGNRMIKQLLNSVIAKYRDLSVSRRSQYFAQPRPIIVK